MLDLQQLRDISHGDPILLDELLKTFIQTTREDLRNLQTAVNNRQNPLIASVAHRIKGGASIVGAHQLMSLAEDLEKKGNQGSEDRYDDLMVSMQDNFAAIERLYPGF